MLLWCLVLAVVIGSGPGCGAIGTASRPEAVWGIQGTRDGWLMKPRVAAFDHEDHLYLADLTDRIQVFDRDGKFLRAWRMPALNVDGPSGLYVDREGEVVVADTHFYRVMIYDRQGRLLRQIGDGVQGTEPGRFGYVTDVVRDRAGRFYVSEYGENDRVQVFEPDGTFVTQWGGYGYEAGEFRRPRALAIDRNDHIYVADSGNHRIQVFDTSGKLLRSWGTRGPEVGQLSFPFDVALDQNDDLYVCEYGNQRVQKFRADGTPLGVWGRAGRAEGELANPWALAVDSTGAVSVVDSGNHRVQRVRL
jgi:DNA-binding beta-propeller fold protein YncE